MLRQDRIQLLIDALRSGEYEQGQKRLTTIEPDGSQKDCCLGVGCKVAIKHGLEIDTEIVEVGSDASISKVEYAHEAQVMPYEVAEWYGLGYDINPILEDSYSAAHLNDNVGYSFAQIADAFEKKYIREEA